MSFSTVAGPAGRTRLAGSGAAIWLMLAMAGCGGGGGTAGSQPPSTPTISLPAASAAYATNPVNFTASSTDPGGLALTYRWDFGDGSPSAGGSTVNHTYGAPGSYQVQVTVTNAAQLSSTAAAEFTAQPSVPSKPGLTMQDATMLYTDAPISMTAASTDPLGRNLGYAWDFGDGQAGAGATVSHSYRATGTYTVTVTATNTSGQAASASQQLTVATPISGMTLMAGPEVPYAGQRVKLKGGARDARNLALNYLWDFGDATADTGAQVTHAYAAPGTYTVKLTVQDSAGSSATASQRLDVLSSAGNAWTVDCSGSHCGAVSGSQYGGSGTGTWRFTNAGSQAAVVDIGIDGVQPGQTATLVFANPGTNTVAQAPSSGVLASPISAATVEPPRTLHFAEQLVDPQWAATAHDALLKANRELVQRLRQASPGRATVSAQPLLRPAAASRAAPIIGTARTWNDTAASTSSPTPYLTTVAATCALPSGRHVVFWLDPDATSAGKVTADDITAMQMAVCGATGGFERMKALLGDLWGAAAAAYRSQLIQDDLVLQDINIAIVNAPDGTRWAGYFTGLNNFLRTASAGSSHSNEALVFFVNAGQIKVSRSYAISTLMHEATHMTNFYQRAVARDTDHDTWLEEGTAMMTEDIIGPVVNAGYNAGVSIRIPSYLATGGGVSLIQWSALSAGNYALAGSFAVYLNRRYGLALYQQLVTDCRDGHQAHDSHACLDTLIKAQGGLGLADEFAHFGAAIFAPLPAPQALDRYGLPSITDGDYTLGAVDVTLSAGRLPAQPATADTTGFRATSHLYVVDTMAAGKARYVRKNLSVPPGATLLLVIR